MSKREQYARVWPAFLPELDEPLGPPYPLVVLGWEVPVHVDVAAQAEELAAGLPAGPRLSLLAHQYGGLACFHAHLLGLALDLPMHHEAQLRALAAEWWGCGPLVTRERPQVDLSAWQRALGPRFPPLVRGDEAFLASRPVPSVEAFLGAQVIEVGSRIHGPLEWAALASDVVVRRVGVLGDRHVALLHQLAARFGGAPSLFWLASSSD